MYQPGYIAQCAQLRYIATYSSGYIGRRAQLRYMLHHARSQGTFAMPYGVGAVVSWAARGGGPQPRGSGQARAEYRVLRPQ
jgi:hypothetical protein